MPMAIIRRRAITLIEILIVIGILSLATGVVAISINKAIVDQNFRSEVDLVVNELRLAQDLMLILGTDVHVYFISDKKNEGIEYGLELETVPPKNVRHELLRKRKQLKAIRGVFLRDELLTEEKEDHIDIKFLSNGAVMSRGTLRLASSSDENVPKGTLESFVCLPGYPNPITSSDSKEEAEKACSGFYTDFDERLTQDTIKRIPEKLKKPEARASAPPAEGKKDDKKTEQQQKPPESK